jgi:CO/xanthine dehydrogenase FAD-binding subunit
MKIINDYDYIKPQEISEALEVLSKYKEKARILAGGTDIIVHLKEEMIKPEILIDVKGLYPLEGIELRKDDIFIGANVTFTQLLESQLIREKYPLLWEASKTVASIGIRNRATLTGNICSAVPSLDSGPALLIYDAEVLVKSINGERVISIHEWFTGPKRTALREDELVLGLSLKIPVEHAGIYEKLGRYKGEDLAQAGIGIYLDINKNYRFASCAVGPVSLRMRALEELFAGKEITDQLISEAIDLIPSEISPITDIRSSAEYRIHMMQVMFKRGLLKADTLLKGGV